MNGSGTTAVIEVSGVHWASSKAVTEAVLGRRPGVIAVDANPVSQTATVTYDPARTNIAALTGWVRDCGYHCAGQSVPDHVCDPLAEPAGQAHHNHGPSSTVDHPDVPTDPARHDAHGAHGGAEPQRSSQDAMGHGGHHGGMSMDDMVRDMRNRFFVAAGLSVPVLLWSPIGREVFGFTVPAPFGLRDDVFSLLLSLPVIFYSAWIFFDGAYRALMARTLDMMVLVAVGVGAGWLYSVGVTLTGGGDVFYEAATVLTAFVLLGHWFEMRARGGANDAIRSLLELAPPKAVVLRCDRGATVRRSRSPRPTSRWVTCCWSARVEDPGRRRRGIRGIRGRRVDGDRGKPARAENDWRAGDRGVGEHVGRTTGPGHQGRRGHGAGADRRPGAGGAELQGPRSATGRPGRVLAGARRADRRRADVRGLAGRRRRGADRAAVRDHRCGDHLPGRAGSGHPDGDHGRHRPRRQARGVVQERHRVGDRRPDRHRGDGQDRHPHQGRTGGHRPACRRHRRTGTAGADGRGGTRIRASARRRCCPVRGRTPCESVDGKRVPHCRRARRGRHGRRAPGDRRESQTDGRRKALASVPSPRGGTSWPHPAAPRCSLPSTAGPSG